MGGCISINRNESNNENTSTNLSPVTGVPQNAAELRKNNPLCHSIIRWKSEIPLTEGQLRSKRDEFWETAPAFEGRREIWDALRAASIAAESSDFELAQAILDGAYIFVPHGYLTECYDELGTEYKLPIYCLSYPINMIREDYGGGDSPAESSEPVDNGIETTLKLRLSSICSDIKLQVYTKDTIGQCKKRLQAQEDVDTFCQRWFYGGKLLGDKMSIEDANIPPGYVVQVIVNTEKQAPNS